MNTPTTTSIAQTLRQVANRCPKCVGLSCLCDGSCTKPTKVAQPVPEQGKRKPLSDEQIIDLAVQWPAETNDWASHFDFARAIEAAHGITATPQGNHD